MKKLLIIVSVLFLASCKKESPQPEPQPEGAVQTPQPPVQPAPLQDFLKTGADSLRQKTAPVNPDKELYAVINYCLTENRIAGHMEEMTAYLVAYEKSDINGIPKIYGTTKEDKVFMRRQVADTVRISINTTRLVRPIKIVSHEDHKGELSYSFIALGKPIFNKEYTRAVIDCNHYCGGLCGSGMRYVLKKDKEGKWEFDKREMVETWIS